MAVIQADIRYFAYYNSIAEMKADKNVKSGYLVTVISNQVCTDYQIKDKQETNAVKLNNGLYANPIYSGNSLSATASEIFATKRPIEYSVGGIPEGTEFQSVTLNEVMNKIFYGDKFIDFTFETNLEKEVHTRGETHNVDRVKVMVERTDKDIVIEEVYRDGLLIEIREDTWYPGPNEIIFTEIQKINSTTVFSVILRDIDGNAVEQKVVEEFKYPIFHNIIAPDFEPNWTLIKDQYPNTKSHSDLVTKVTLNGTSAFLAVPIIEVELDSVIDENNFHVQNIYDSWQITMTLGSDEVPYMCYRSRALNVDDFLLTYKFKEVLE